MNGNDERHSVIYLGRAVDIPCPCCREPLWVFVPAEGEIQVRDPRHGAQGHSAGERWRRGGVEEA
jgi:hypothetical protein